MSKVEWIDLKDATKSQLAICIAEEGAEITQAITKCIRFGVYERHPDWQPDETNLSALMDEFAQLYHEVRHFCAKHGENFGYEMEKRPAKKLLVMK